MPGIDFAGVVAEGSYSDFKPGDWVVLNGWGTPVGIDSTCPQPERLVAWQRLAQELDTRLEATTTEAQLADVVAVAPRFLEGKVRGRMLVSVNEELG